MNIGDKLYYARILNNTCDVCDLVIRTVENDYFVGVDKHDKHAYLLPYSYLGVKVFKDRKDALELTRREEDKLEER